jgi:alpha-tubulin suppressor-like RCC1 family protein
MLGISTAVKAVGGLYHTLVLLSDGTAKAAGYNSSGGLGDGTTTNRSTAVAVSGLTNVTALAAGQYHSLALRSDGTLKGWGSNLYGQVGDGSTTDRHSPTSLSSLSSMATIGAGAFYSIAVSSTGVVYTWGHNNYSQLGDGTTTNRSTPTAISDAGYAWKVASPAFSPGAGTYYANVNVTVSTATSGATMHYTLNGNEPTTSDSTVASGSSVTISSAQTLKVKAFKSGMAPSTTAAVYDMKVGAIGYSPGPGTYTSAQNVTLSTATPGATIRYTTDGSTPTASSTTYTGAITVATGTVLKAVGLKAGWTDSTVASGTYTMYFGTLATPSADHATGTYVGAVTVALSAMAGATLRYTTNGAAVDGSSPIYTTALTFDVTTTLRFKAFHPDYLASSEVTRTYTLTPAAPVFDPAAGTYTAGQVVTITGTTAGSTMRYTINGAEPTTSDPVIASGSTIVVGNFTLKAKAFKTGTTASATTTAAYTISGEVTPPALAAGIAHSLAIRSDGTTWAWGHGNLGTGANTPSSLPVLTSGLTGAVAADGGYAFSHVVKLDGALAAFGWNTYGQLGTSTTDASYLPAAVTGLTGIIAVSAAEDHAIAVKGDGTIYGWGRNLHGEVGDGTTTQRTSPVALSSLTAMAAVSAGRNFSLALKQDGTIKSWGVNGTGQLGNGTTTNASSPTAVSSISTATAISAGLLHALALLADGSVRSWGYNYHGQLGNGLSGWSTDQSSPVEVAGLDDVIAIGAGGSFSVALTDDGRVWTWGDNSFGELGDGTTTPRASAATVAGLPAIVKIAVGSNHVLAMTADATVYAWGLNSGGQLGDGTTTNRLTPIQISGPGMAWRVPAPALSVASGLYYADQIVTVTIPDPDATLRYTTTGIDPASTDATVANGGTIAIPHSQTLKVSGWKTGHTTSVVTARTYELKVVTPVMTPGAGAYGSSQNVAMSTTTSGATIRYTTDGTEPTSSSTAYASAIMVPDTQTVKARASKTGWTDSDSGHASYVISAGTVATPVITPAGGTHASPPLVAITVATSAATIRYTLDGSTPTAVSPVFVYPFLATVTTTVKARAFKAGYTASAVASTTYEVDASGAAATPLMSPAGGWFSTQQIVTITGSSGATLRYTTDGTDPTTSSTTITSGSTITVDRSEIVKVRAWANGSTPSAVRRADFVITGAVAAGYLHSMAIRSDHSLWTWGGNPFGQLANGGTTAASVPAQVMTQVAAVAGAERHTVIAKTDGTLWGAGDGVLSAVQVSGFTNAVAVAAGRGHSLVLKSDGTVWAYGANGSGELGDGTTTGRSTPVQVVGLSGIVAIAAGAESSYALQTDGAGGGILWSWGANTAGQLGDGSTTRRLTPTRVVGIGNAVAIAAGSSAQFAVALRANGQVVAWGQNNLNQIGIGTTANQLTPVALPIIQAARLIAAGTNHAIVVDAAARSWAWGHGLNGALGLGANTVYQSAPIPRRSDVGGVLAVAAGDAHTLAAQPDGTVRAYAANGRSPLGNGPPSYTELTGVVMSGLTLADNAFLAADQDADDLVTWREYLLGTDPLNPDTNGNGILDGHDDAIGANGLDPDSDDDGVPNWIEQTNGTDPFNADTDGDSVNDANDAFPLDPTRSMAPSSNPSDTTPPVVTLKEPVSAQLIP